MDQVIGKFRPRLEPVDRNLKRSHLEASCFGCLQWSCGQILERIRSRVLLTQALFEGSAANDAWQTISTMLCAMPDPACFGRRSAGKARLYQLLQDRAILAFCHHFALGLVPI